MFTSIHPILTLLTSVSLLGSHAPRAQSGVAPDSATCDATVRVVVTQPAYATLVEELGGSSVVVTSIASAAQDPHTVVPRPSFALEIRRAQLFVTTGLDLELWAPALLDKAGNSQVMEGASGYVTAYTGVELLDIPASVDRSAGDVHIYGNPHLHTEPLTVLQIARNITVGLRRVTPRCSEHFDEGLASFTDRIHRRLFGDHLVDLLGGDMLEELALSGTLNSFLEGNSLEGVPLIEHLGGWLEEAAPLRGKKMICYHPNWSYFEDRFGVDCVATVETRPGIPPTPRHVVELLRLMENEGIRVVVGANYFDRNKVNTVARRGNAVPVVLPLALQNEPGGHEYFDLVDIWVSTLVEAFRQAEQLGG
jgi:zinc/manganese transport system substrate-binding protein